jgi:hypothetical protein
LLVFPDIRDGIDRHRIARQLPKLPVKRGNIDTYTDNKYYEQTDHQLVLKTKTNESIEWSGEVASNFI